MKIFSLLQKSQTFRKNCHFGRTLKYFFFFKKPLILKKSISSYALTSVEIGVLRCNVAEYKSILLWLSIEV